MQLTKRSPSLKKPKDPKLIWKDVICTLFKQKIFMVAARLKALAHAPSERACTKVVNNVNSNQFGISGLLEAWIMLDKFYQGSYNSPLKFPSATLLCCEASEQNSFLGYETSPDSPSAGRVSWYWLTF